MKAPIYYGTLLLSLLEIPNRKGSPVQTLKATILDQALILLPESARV